MNAPARAVKTGPLGPVFISAAVILLATSALMRGGNRQVALIALEWIAEVALFASVLSWCARPRNFAQPSGDRRWDLLVAILVLSPAWVGLLQLFPLPFSLWSGLPGRDVYASLSAGATGISRPSVLPLSLAPDATQASLLAGLPIVTAFLAAYSSTDRQLKLLLYTVVASAFFQLAVAVGQFIGGPGSMLYFGGDPGRPFGTFANPNHFANYMAMALTAYLCLGWPLVLRFQQAAWQGPYGVRDFPESRRLILFSLGALAMIFGVLISESRGALLLGVPAALAGLPVCILLLQRIKLRRLLAAGLGFALLVAVCAVAFLPGRFAPTGVAAAASIRQVLTGTTLAGAHTFWPWGAGWGTYEAVYPRFEPLGSDGFVNHAHQDFAQMLFEGGMLAVVLWMAFAALAAARAAQLAKAAHHSRNARPLAIPILCAFGLLGFLLHSFVDFSMHIPANAMLAAMLAGAYLRPTPAVWTQA